jgi:hypothetical protein
VDRIGVGRSDRPTVDRFGVASRDRAPATLTICSNAKPQD